MSVQPRLPFALPDITDAEIEAVAAALRSGWLSSGPKVREFEARFSEAIGAGVEAVAVNSATAGLHLALEAIGIAPGDEVLVPTWTFTATAEVVRYLGAEPVLVDVDPVTLHIDFDHASTLVTPRTRAVMPVHFAGLPISAKLIKDFAGFYGLSVVEDAAHAFPAAQEGKRVGSGGSQATVFSFYATKTMTTGEGGMLVTRDPAVAERARVMRLHGISRDAFDRYRSTIPAWRYEVVAPGFKYNLTDPAAAMGLVQLSRAEAMRTRRWRIAQAYADAFKHTSLSLPSPGSDQTEHAWHLYVVRLPDSTDRDVLIAELAELGVATSVHFIPLHLHPYWRDRRPNDGDDLPHATREFQRVLSLPIFSSMTDGDVNRVIEAVIAVLGR